jgi:radical SAM-linked protein
MTFYKKGDLVFISHLDLMRLFQRAFRRSNLPIAYTQGFNPHMRMSFKRALALGKSSRSEHMKVVLTERIVVDRLKKIINLELPNGIGIKKIQYN